MLMCLLTLLQFIPRYEHTIWHFYVNRYLDIRTFDHPLRGALSGEHHLQRLILGVACRGEGGGGPVEQEIQGIVLASLSVIKSWGRSTTTFIITSLVIAPDQDQDPDWNPMKLRVGWLLLLKSKCCSLCLSRGVHISMYLDFTLIVQFIKVTSHSSLLPWTGASCYLVVIQATCWTPA